MKQDDCVYIYSSPCDQEDLEGIIISFCERLEGKELGKADIVKSLLFAAQFLCCLDSEHKASKNFPKLLKAADNEFKQALQEIS